MYKVDSDKHEFIKAHGDFIINKWLSYYDNKSFDVISMGNFGFTDNNCVKLFVDAMNYLGYDVYTMSYKMYYLYPEYRPDFISMKRLNCYDFMSKIRSRYNHLTVNDMVVEDEIDKILDYNVYNIDRVVLRCKQSNKIVKMSLDLYPFDLENELFLARDLADYLHSNRGINVKSDVTATLGCGFICASIKVKLPDGFTKYHNFASCKPIVSSTYNHTINGLSSNQSYVYKPIRYNQSCLDPNVKTFVLFESDEWHNFIFWSILGILFILFLWWMI